jgi:integrase/recombinase XerD
MTHAESPQGMSALLTQFADWLRIHNFAETTVVNRVKSCGYFITWAQQRGVDQPCEVTRPVIECYQRFLFHRRKPNGKPLSTYTQLGYLTPLRAWFKWLWRQHHIRVNPTSDLDLPRLEFQLPKHVLSAREADLVLSVPKVNEPLGLRDRTILEVLYSTGVRRLELVQLRVYDVDRERGLVAVRQGKGRKDRVVPIGERALAWVARYLEGVRPQLCCGLRSEDYLFLSASGERLSPNWLSVAVAAYVRKAELGKQGSCHLFRHTMATLLLEAGADIRIIQEILGHSSLETTQIYTRVSVKMLKEVHTAKHPARLERSSKGE